MTEDRLFNHTGYNAYLSEHQLMAARCAECGTLYLPPRTLCIMCYSTRMGWVPLSGEGRLTGFTTVFIGLPAMAAEGYGREKPYCSGIVRLAEGPAICAQILGVDASDPTGARIGMPLRAVFIERASSPAGQPQVFLAFKPQNDV